ncbi:hypothetical protein [Pediococcus acidilactici]|uniref:hypothetical protein n=1 Tax=Pediococcus acidilactici TaxID=1254 RepID=UPI003D76D65B
MSSIGQGSISIDDSTRIGQNAQDTANEVAGNVSDINSDNKLTLSEKLKLKQEYDKDVELYNVDIGQLKSVDLPTAELETAMSNLTGFVTPLFKEMNRTSTVDRNTLDSVFTAFATADKNSSQAFENMVRQVADGAKKAGDDAKEAGEEAKASATQAKVDATKAKADAATAQQKAQSSIDQLNAHLPDIDEALNTANLVKQDVTKLSNTTEQYHNEYTTGIQNVIKTIDDTSTEIDQLNNAIKLKADSTDVTSQINVAVQGIQSEVKDKVTDLTTKISQTDSAWRASVSTLGTTNMVYNGGFAHGVDGWNTEDGKWAWSNQPQDQVQGNNAIQSIFKGLTTDTWNNAESKPFLVCPGQKMSIGAIVTPWVLDSDPKKGFGIGLEFFASKDGTGTRNSYHPEQWVYTTGRQQLKVENITVPEGVNSAAVRLFIQRNGGANFTCVQANMTPTLPQFIDGFATATDITASINDINLKVANSDGSSSQVNINDNTILLDANKIIFNGKTSILDASIDTAKIADAAINNAKIANAAIDDAKISNLNGNKLIENSITANKINVDDLIANGINTKTLTSVNLNTSTLITPHLDLGLNGTFTENYDYTQSNLIFLPKKNKGKLTFNHGVLQSEGSMQTYANGKWGGMNDNYTFQAGIDNNQWTEVAPGYIKLDLFKQNDTDVAERTYVDPTGFYFTTTGNQTYTSYVGNIVSTPQVQTASVVAKTIDPLGDQKRLEIDHSGSKIGLQVGSYAGKEAVLSDYIYDFAFSASSNVYITSNGHLARSTSASKYKYNISNPDYEDVLGDRLLNVHLASWNDKNAIDSYAHTLNTGEDTEKLSIDKYHGLIAEQLRDAGLGMFVEYNENGEIEGIQYDRAWIPLLAVVRRLNNKINEYEMRISKLEGKK